MRSALIVEDEALVAMLLEDLLDECGFQSVVCGSVDEAMLSMAQADFKLAILDVNLGGSLSYPVADALIVGNIPFAFATGYGRSGVDAKYADVPVLHKPFDSGRLKKVVNQLVVE